MFFFKLRKRRKKTLNLEEGIINEDSYEYEESEEENIEYTEEEYSEFEEKINEETGQVETKLIKKTRKIIRVDPNNPDDNNDKKQIKKEKKEENEIYNPQLVRFKKIIYCFQILCTIYNKNRICC